MSELAVILLAAAAALSAVELVGGPIRGRALGNRYAVLRWLLHGLGAWSPDFLSPGFFAKFKRLWRPKQALMTAEWRIKEDVRVPSDSNNGFKPQDSIEGRLKRLAAGSAKAAFYQLEADQMAAQISAAAEAALDKPAANRRLLIALAGLTKAEVVSGDGPDSADLPVDNYLLLERFDPSIDKKSFVAVRHDLVFRIQRRLDNLQIKTRGVQEIGDHIGFIGLATVAAFYLGSQRWLILGVVAGFISPLLRRIVRAASR